jgi:hypothetical protein
MPVSGLVVTLPEDPLSRGEALSRISGDQRLTMGVCEGNRLALVMDTHSSEEDRQLWDWLGSLPGVSNVEVAFIAFEPPDDCSAADGARNPP